MAHIKAENVVVEFPIYDASHRSMRRMVLRGATGGNVGQARGGPVTVRAIDHVDLNVIEGDRIGLLGHNGSGKTTLLRVLSRVYEPISGKIEVRGRVVPLLDIAMGIDPDATGYENIVLRGLMLGVKSKVMKAKTEEISEFSGLGDYLALPVRTYSTGMMLRLAFAVSTSIDADILLMDEWLSVGDAEFQEKASTRLHELIKRSAIVIMASHNVDIVEKVCTRVLQLEHGRIISERAQSSLQSI